MAALGSIRKRGVTLVIIIGLGLFAFIAEEMVRSCEATGNEKRQQVGEVLGEKISVQEFQALVDEYQEVIKMTQGRDNLTEDELNQVKDQVWNQYVNNAIVADEAEKLGLTVTDTELQNMIKEGSSPMLMQTPFVNQQTGRFDASALTKFLAEYKKAMSGKNPQVAEQYQTIYKYWKFVEKNLRTQTLAQKYQNLISHSLLSNPISAKMAFEGQNEESDIQLAAIPYSTIKDDKVTVSESDIKAKYDSEKAKYKQYVESRDIKYVDFLVEASAADRKALQQTMAEANKQLAAGEAPATVMKKAQSQVEYNGLMVTKKALPYDIAAKVDSMSVGQTTQPFESKTDNTLNVVKLLAKTQAPDSIEYRQIQVAGATVEKARATSDSIANALKAGADFETIAKKYGQEGKPIWLTSAMYESSSVIDADSKAYLSALTTMGAKEIRNIPFTSGNIVVQVLSRKAMVDKYDVAIVKRAIDFSKATYSAAYNKFSQFVSENQTLEAMEKNCGKYGFKVQERKDIFNTEHTVAGIRATRDAMKWIFDAKAGDVSPLYECGNNDHLLVVAMTKIHPAGYRSLDDVKTIVKAEVMRDKKFEQIESKLKGVNSIAAAKGKGANVTTVNQITFSAPVFVQSTGSSEPALSGAVAATKQGAFCNRVIKGNSGAYMLQVAKKSKRDGKFDSKAMETQLQQQALNAAARFLQELYLKAGVVDNRYLFF